MKRLTVILSASLALAVPTFALAEDSTPSAKELAKAACKAERAGMGKSAWKATWRSEGLGRCIQARTKTEQSNLANAAKQCKAERADANFAASHGGKTFEQVYGTNKNGRNAYGKCVSTKAKAKSEAQTDARVAAAKSCKTQRKNDAAGFAAQWGTKKNAFGKCVSATAKAKND
jgi:hypothetical protein